MFVKKKGLKDQFLLDTLVDTNVKNGWGSKPREAFLIYFSNDRA